MKILFLSHQYPPETNWGGIGSYTATMSRALSERGHEVHVLTCWDGQQSIDRMEGDVVVHRRQNVRIPGLRRFLRLPGVRAAARPLRTPEAQSSANPSLRLKTAITCYREHSRLAVDFDVVEAPDWMAEGLVFGLRHPIPLVVDLKGNLLTYTRSSGWDLTWHGRISSWLEEQAVARATIVTAPSRLTSDDLAQSGWSNVSGARIIRRPVDVTRWKPTSAAATKPVILQIGRLEAIKAPDVLLRAAARLTKSIPHVEVVFVGAPYGLLDGIPTGERLPQLAEQLGVNCRIIAHAPWSEIAAWYARARVVAIASRYDNFPNVGLEAMASGRPVVCSSRTGLAEMAEDAGAAIAVTPPDNAEELALRLEPYLADAALATEAGDSASQFVRQTCTPQVIAAQREEVYLDAIRR